jgi:hypothetical protein
MKKTQMVSLAVVAALAAGSIATPTFAHDYGYGYGDSRYDYCRQKGKDGAVAGALLGALAGAVLGSNVSGHGARSEGGAIGAAAGAAIGAGVGHSTAKQNCRARYGYYDGYGYRNGYAYDSRYDYRTDQRRYYGSDWDNSSRDGYGQPYYGYDERYGYGYQGPGQLIKRPGLAGALFVGVSGDLAVDRGHLADRQAEQAHADGL